MDPSSILEISRFEGVFERFARRESVKEKFVKRRQKLIFLVRIQNASKMFLIIF